MAKSWAYHFQYSLSETSRVTGIPLPAPQSIFGTFAATTATVSALLNALKVVAPKSALTVGQLIAAARTVGISTLGAATATELIAVAGGVTAAFYIGSLAGAALYATEQVLVGDWLDKVFDDYLEAQENAKALARASKRVGAPPLQCGKEVPAALCISESILLTPARSCSGPVSDYGVGWPKSRAPVQ
jgi:hypothetical protein